MKNLRTASLALLVAMMLSSCAQITYNITVTGEQNRITANGAVDKTTDDLMDMEMAGSAYGDAHLQGGKK